MALRSASSATEIPLRLPRLHEGQQKVRAESRRFNVLNCGRRWGKTTYGLDVLLDDPRRLGALDGYPVAWFAPNSKLFDEVWWEATRLLRPISTRIDSQKNRIDLITGGTIDFWTLHNTDDPGRGRKYGRIFVDEAAIVPSARLEKQWNEAIRPTLTDLTGAADFGSTPKGAGVFQEFFKRGQNPDEPDWASWQLPTTSNPFIDPAEVEAARRELPSAAFRQEYLAEFVTDFGAVFKAATYYEPDELPKDGFREATGCDFAYTLKSGDWTVFITGRLYGGVIYVTGLYREQAEATTWAARLRGCPAPFAFIGGQESGIAAFLRKDYGVALRTERAATDKLARAHPAAAAWNRGEIRLPRGAPISTEIEAEVLAFTGDSRVDEHDDIVDALAGLHHALIGKAPATAAAKQLIRGW